MLFAVTFIIAMITGLVLRKRVGVMALLSALASLLLIAEAVKGISFSFQLFGLTFTFATDELSRYFCILIGIAGIAVSIYTIGYMKAKHLSAFAYPLFILSMALIVLSRDFVTFILFWELMTLASFVLILNDYEKEETKKAGLIYLVAMHALNTAPLVIAIGALYSYAGTLDYSALSGFSVPSWILWAFMIGFIVKAGLFPFHFWLPEAHPVAPSNVSALLSGVMLKMAVYGMLRIAGLFPDISILAVPIIILSMTTIAIGALLMIVQRDLKRMIAYSSVDNLGYIFLAFGAYILLDEPMKTVALAALLFHTFNHMLFKNLLFMLSGNVLHATGRKDVDLRGLSNAMPYTATLSLVGILAVSGIPPTNGFISKWLIYQATFLSGNLLLVLGGVVALLGSAITLAAYVKFYRIFTGKQNVKAEEANISMLTGEIILAALCILFGVFPWAWMYISKVQVPMLLNLPLLILVLVLSFAMAFILLTPEGRKVEVWTTGEEVEDFEIKPEHMFQPVSSIVDAMSRFGIFLERKARVLERVFSVGDTYLDEALVMPLARIVSGTATVMKELSKGLNLMLATTFIALVSMVVIFLVIMGVV